MRVLVVSGSSGGHIFPALGLIASLKAKDSRVQVLLVLPKRSIKIPLSNDYRIAYISTDSLRFSLDYRNFLAILKFIKGAFESALIIFKFRPDVVVGFGSINSIPLILLSRIRGSKTVIHEQNVIPGRANRLLSRFAQLIAVSFEQTRDYFPRQKDKVLFTGNPLRKDLAVIDRPRALKYFGFDENYPVILVTGGSQGSHNINTGFFEAISVLSKKAAVQVIHICGSHDFDGLQKKYSESKIRVKIFSFLGAMQYAYSASDLVVSRAGATSIAEISFYRLPAILLPYPFAYLHQLENARVLKDLGSAEIIYDQELDSVKLSFTLERLINNPDALKVMSSSYGKAPIYDSKDLLSKAVLAL